MCFILEDCSENLPDEKALLDIIMNTLRECIIYTLTVLKNKVR